MAMMEILNDTPQGKTVAPALLAAREALLCAITAQPMLNDTVVTSQFGYKGFTIGVKRGEVRTGVSVESTSGGDIYWRKTTTHIDEMDADSTVTVKAGRRFGGERGYDKVQIGSIKLSTLTKTAKAAEIANVLARALQQEALHDQMRRVKVDRDTEVGNLTRELAEVHGLREHADFALQAQGGTVRLAMTLTDDEARTVVAALAAARMKPADGV